MRKTDLVYRVWRRRTALPIAVALLTGACATVPITGRSQLCLLPNDQLVDAANQSFERFMADMHRKGLVLSASESPRAAHEIEMVNRVSNRIIQGAGLQHRYKWETVLIKRSDANAGVMPNGKIIVFSGLLSIAKDEAGLAAVIGHEVGHVIAQHHCERISQMLVTQLTIQTVDVALQLKRAENRPLVLAALGLGAEVGILRRFSREHEKEADRLGLVFMAKAGYDPSEALGLWERMEAQKRGTPWEFLSTHPSPATRRDEIRQWLPEVRRYYTSRSPERGFLATQPSPGLPAPAPGPSTAWDKSRGARVISQADIFQALPEPTSWPSLVRRAKQGERLNYMNLRASGRDGVYLLIRDSDGWLGWVNEAQVEPAGE